MSKYNKLTLHLASRDDSVWEARFEEIEDILGFALPPSAYRHNAWWANQIGNGHAQSTAWRSAGWKTAELNLRSETVTFLYSGGFNVSGRPDVRPLTIAEAKKGLASQFGVPEDRIEITIRG